MLTAFPPPFFFFSFRGRRRRSHDTFCWNNKVGLIRDIGLPPFPPFFFPPLLSFLHTAISAVRTSQPAVGQVSRRCPPSFFRSRTALRDYRRDSRASRPPPSSPRPSWSRGLTRSTGSPTSSSSLPLPLPLFHQITRSSRRSPIDTHPSPFLSLSLPLEAHATGEHVLASSSWRRRSASSPLPSPPADHDIV